MEAKDIMHKHVVTVMPNMTVHEVAKIFRERCISGAPVVDSGGGLVGVVSQTDLVEQKSGSAAGASFYRKESHAMEEAARSRGLHIEDVDYTRVEQVMTPWVVSFEEDTPVAEIARQMLAKRIHRVMITREGKLCGIVTSMDMLRALLKTSSPQKGRRKISLKAGKP